MQKNCQILFFLKNFSTGIFTPIISLLLLSRGASLRSLAWILGTYCLTVVLMEFPSGVLCDLWGRKRTFLLSCVISLFSLCFLCLLPNITGAFLGFLFYGFSRAFASGSLDALMIEQEKQSGGEAALAKINGRLGILESTGIAAGSLLGGILAGIGNRYQANLLCIFLLYLVVLFLSIFCLQEPLYEKPIDNSLLAQSKNSLLYTFHVPKLRLLLLLSLATGMVLFTVETYYQPFFSDLPDFESWKLGILTCCSFLCTALGSKLIAKQLTKFQNENEQYWGTIFCLTKISFALCVFFLAVPHILPVYIFVYCLIYLFLGSSSVTENSLLSKLVPNHLRASIMSLFSLCFQLGALIASGVSGILVSLFNIQGLWLLAGSFLFFLLLLVVMSRKFTSKDK